MLVEFVRNGAYLKCSAIHVATGREVSALGPVDQRTQLERITIAKLRRVVATF